MAQVQIKQAGRFISRTVKAAAAAGVMAIGTVAHAAGEGTEAVSQITEAATTVAAVGAAVLGVYVAIKVFKFVRSAL